LCETVRFDGPAAVHVRVDQRCQGAGRLDDVVQLEADLPQHPEVRAKAGGVDDQVGVDVARLAATTADDPDAAGTRASQLGDLETVNARDLAGIDQLLYAGAERRPSLQLVVCRAEHADRGAVAD